MRRRLVERGAPLAAVVALAAGLATVLTTSVSAPARAQEEAVPACPPPAFRAQLMTPLAGAIPRDGAVVVGLFPGGGHASLPPLSLARGRRSLGVRTEPIAPGLYRAIPDARRVAGRWTLSGVEGGPELLFARAAIPPPPARPALARVERYLVASPEGSRTEVKAHFAFPVPDGVVAVIAAFGEEDAPALFARGIPQRSDLVLWASSGRCPALPPGGREPPEHGAVRVAFVDLFGQVSQLSDPQSL